MKAFFVMMLFVCIANAAVVLNDEELEKGLPEFKLDLDADDEILMKALPELRGATGKLYTQCIMKST